MKDFDIDAIADSVENKFNVEFRDPFEKPYGDPERQTDSQKIAWEYMQNHNVWRQALIGAKGAGKGQPLDEPVLTPLGWRKMGDLQVGDAVTSRDGSPTTVIGVFPQGKRPVYRVTFNDGTSTRTDDSHLWAVRTGSMKHRGKGFEKIKSTPELMRDLKTSQGYNKWQVPTVDPVKFDSGIPIPVSPYALGALIGDGCFRGGTPGFTSADYEIVERVATETDTEISERYREFDYGLLNGGLLKRQLTVLGLYGKTSHGKFIPERYLRASVEDRKELMRGLMDTDGTVSGKTGTFCTVSRQLADDFAELARSLGVVTKVRTRTTNGGCGYAYRVSVNASFNPFWIDRKAEKYDVNAPQGDVKTIESIDYIGEEETQCIKVAAEDSLYVTNDYAVTHNTYLGAAFAFKFGQEYPGSRGAVVGNTDRQAKDAAGGAFMDICQALGYRAEYFQRKKIRGNEYTKFYIVDLDGQGFQEGNTFKLFVRSMVAVETMEGSKFDFMWFEEIQQAEKKKFVKANSRNRRNFIADADTRNPLFIAGMTDSGTHWMYKMLEENMGFKTKDEFDPETDHSLLLEPVLEENRKNLGSAKIQEYYNTFSATDAERLIHAKRVSHNADRALYEYKENIHKEGRMSRLMCHYDPYAELILSLDFNISPMCGSLWQRVPFNQKWLNGNVRLSWEDDHVAEVAVLQEDGNFKYYDSLREFAEPNQNVLAQIDEWEVWPGDPQGGGTKGLMRHVVRDYAEKHQGSIEIIGDAQGNSKTAASTTTNWDIVREKALAFDDPIVMPGLISNRNGGGGATGKIKWSNPPVEDTLTHTNEILHNANGNTRMCFLPESEYESGGVAASVAVVERRGSGKIDDRRDRSDDKSKPRTHWFDTVRYLGWYFKNEVDEEQRDIGALVDEMKSDRDRSRTGNMPDGMDPERYTGFGDDDQGGWMDFGGSTSGGVF